MVNALSLRAYSYFHADDSRLAQPHVRLAHADISAVRRLVQVEDTVGRGRRDLRGVAETWSQSLPEGLPVQRDES